MKIHRAASPIFGEQKGSDRFLFAHSFLSLLTQIGYILPVIQAILHFWLSHPALLYGVAFLLGIFSCLLDPFLIIVPALSLWIPFIWASLSPARPELIKPLVLSVIVFATAWIYAANYSSSPSLPSEGVFGQAHLRIKNISLQSHFFGKRWIYRCEICQFYEEGEKGSIASSLPCLVTLPAKVKPGALRPLANQEYWVPGKLIQTKQRSYLLKVSSKAIWTPIPDTVSWAERRWKWKKKGADWIKSQFTHPQSGAFLAGLATGEFDDYWMRQQFSRFGLQHLLAISGFHFAIIAGFLSFFLSMFFGRTIRIGVLLLCLGAYCLFLGPQSSILRAWLMCSLALLGGLFEKQTSSLNLLGIALLIILGYNPHFSGELGFQLSFATTAAILFFYSPAKAWLNHLFPKRLLSEVLQLNGWNQHAYCTLAFLKQGLALILAVNAFALPLTLFYFQQFPLMSILYNLFFPFLASASLCLLLLGSGLSFIPFLGAAIHGLNDRYTFFMLQLTYQIPSEMDAYLQIESFTAFWLIGYMSLASLGGIIWRGYSNEREGELFAYL